MWKILSPIPDDGMYTRSTLQRQIKQLHDVWNGKGYTDFGLERLLRLALVILPFLDLGLYLRNCFQGKGKCLSRKIATDIYVFLNAALPYALLFCGGYKCSILVYVCVYFGVTTLVALFSMSFLRSSIPASISHQRNVICLFLNFLQYVGLFAVIYMFMPDGFKPSYLTPLQAVYLSLEVFTSVGFGDIIPKTDATLTVLIVQMLLQVIFVYLLVAEFVGKKDTPTFYNKKKGIKRKED